MISQDQAEKIQRKALQASKNGQPQIQETKLRTIDNEYVVIIVELERDVYIWTQQDWSNYINGRIMNLPLELESHSQELQQE